MTVMKPTARKALPPSAAATVAKNVVVLLLCFIWIPAPTSADSSFDPYQLNGGLVAAVAGRDFVVVGCDTRLSNGRYDILQRNHLSSRIWTATTSVLPLPIQDDENENDRIDDDDDQGEKSKDNFLSGQDHEDDDVVKESTVANTSPYRRRSSSRSSLIRIPITAAAAPLWVASAGCNADCEALKRTTRSLVRSAGWAGEGSFHTTHQLACFLSHLLYERRGFPWYCFCVVAGVDEAIEKDDDGAAANGGGRVYGFDAIGSFERIAVATAGTGRELLQPILDRQFDTLVRDVSATSAAVAVARQQQQQQIMLQDRQLSMQVSCSKHEAVRIVRDAYRAVSERDIAVGDFVVIYTIQRRNRTKEQKISAITPSNAQQQQQACDNYYELQAYCFPLKQH